MAASSTQSSVEPRVARMFPQWFKDLDSQHKPVVSSLVLLTLALPTLIYTSIHWRRAAEIHDQIALLIERGGRGATLVELTQNYQSEIQSVTFGILLTAVVAGIGALWIAYGTSKLSAEWLASLSARVARAADGDLTTRIERDNNSQIGEIQDALGTMIASFNDTVTRIDHAATDLRDAAIEMSGITDEAGSAIGEVAHSVAIISIGAGNQVDLIGETVEEVGAIEKAVVLAVEHAENVSRQSLETVALTSDGVARAAEIEESIELVRMADASMAELVFELGRKSTDIDRIVGSIAEIAEQTNLLALNAAIEAARAGEQGRGFAVVAEEVRKLAEDAQSRTDEIAEMTKEIRECTQRAVTAVEQGAPAVAGSIAAIGQNRAAFTDISVAAEQLNVATDQIAQLAAAVAQDALLVRSEIEDIASVAQESSASTEQVSAATEESSASSEEVTAAAARVATTADSLTRMVTDFTIVREQPAQLKKPAAKRVPELKVVDDEAEAREMRA